MGHLNKRSFLARLQRLGLASRADLAKSLGMSQPTAGKIADELLRLGVLEEVEVDKLERAAPAANRSPRLGRPGRMLRLDRTRPRFLGMQLGVSSTTLAPLPVGAESDDRWTVRFATADTADKWVGDLQKAAVELPVQNLWGVLVSVPGIVDEPSGRVLFSPNLHWTENMDLPDLIRRVWNAPVMLVQEERALALGHRYANPEEDDFLLVDFGDGVGGAVILGGALSANPLPISGELGHTPVLGNERPCGCGAVGCLETLMSTRGLLQSFAAAHPRANPAWATLVRFVQERGAEPWLLAALDATAAIVAGSLNVLGLRRAIVTGSLAELPPAVFRHLADAVVRGSLWGRFGQVECAIAPRRRTAGLVAVAIDRLVVPMTEVNGHEAKPRAAMAGHFERPLSLAGLSSL
jgi:predicted NBD/HSP70 family sugar kinase